MTSLPKRKRPAASSRGGPRPRAAKRPAVVDIPPKRPAVASPQGGPSPRGGPAGAETLLYGSTGSGAAAIEAALAIARVPFRLVETATWEKNAAYDDLLKVNPLGQVPTLVLPDGTVLSESAAILIHLGLAHPESGLVPRESSARARTLHGLVFVAANCYTAIGVIDYPERWTLPADDAATHKRLRAGARARLHANWAAFADLFTRAPYLGGASPDALDLFAVVVSKWSGTRAFLREHRPALHDTLVRIESHPAVAPVLARHWPSTP